MSGLTRAARLLTSQKKSLRAQNRSVADIALNDQDAPIALKN